MFFVTLAPLVAHSKSASFIVRHSILLSANHFNEYNWQKERIGNRMIVGPANGPYNFMDSTDRPYPSLRFRADDDIIRPIREKELGDWKSMSIDEKKLLYRYSFKRTRAELLNWNHYSKMSFAYFFIFLTVAFLVMIFFHRFINPGPVPTLDDDYKSCEMRRKLILEKYMIEGASQYYDYENDRWKD